MPNDAKFGLVAGVALVIAIGVVYYRKDAGGAPEGVERTAAVVAPAAGPAQRATVAHTSERRHRVAEGDTLYDLAKRYYGDADKSEKIFQANIEAVKSREQLTPGTELVIPDLPAAPRPR